MKKIIISICLCLPILTFAGKLVDYSAIKLATLNNDDITLTFNANKLNGTNNFSHRDFLKHTFNNAIIKSNGNINFFKDYLRVNSPNKKIVIHTVNYIVKPDQNIVIVGSDHNSLTYNIINQNIESTKIGSGITFKTMGTS